MYDRKDPTFQALDILKGFQHRIAKNVEKWHAEADNLESFFKYFKDESGYNDLETIRSEREVKVVIKCGSYIGELHYQLTPLGRIDISHKFTTERRVRYGDDKIISKQFEISDFRNDTNATIKEQFTVFLQQFVIAMEDFDRNIAD